MVFYNVGNTKVTSRSVLISVSLSLNMTVYTSDLLVICWPRLLPPLGSLLNIFVEKFGDNGVLPLHSYVLS